MSTTKTKRTTKKTAAEPRKVTIVIHNTGSEGIDAHVFEGTAEERQRKALDCVGGLIENYIDNRSRMSETDNDYTRSLLAAGRIEEALESWTLSQDEGDEVSYWEQESIDIRESEVR